jgi:hypothetical protein
MTDLIKSIIVCAVILLLVALAAVVVRILISKLRRKKYIALLNLLIIIPLLVIIVFLSNYVYPYERNVELELVHVAECGHRMDERTLPWHAYYEDYGWGAKSRFIIFVPASVHDDCMEVMSDLDNYTYIISYGRTLETLTYNVWDSKMTPILDLGTSDKNGHVTYGENGDPNCVYIYRIKKMRIEFEGL